MFVVFPKTDLELADFQIILCSSVTGETYISQSLAKQIFFGRRTKKARKGVDESRAMDIGMAYNDTNTSASQNISFLSLVRCSVLLADSTLLDQKLKTSFGT